MSRNPVRSVRSRKLIMLSLMEGKTNRQILDTIDEEIPGNSSSLGSIAWYRMRARQASLKVPSSRELRGPVKEIGVTVRDDKDRRTLCRWIVNPLFPRGPKVKVHVKHMGKKVQEPVVRDIVIEGEQLKHAIRRAKRWFRVPRPEDYNPPHHILVFMNAFKNADPEGFVKFMRDELAMEEGLL